MARPRPGRLEDRLLEADSGGATKNGRRRKTQRQPLFAAADSAHDATVRWLATALLLVTVVSQAGAVTYIELLFTHDVDGEPLDPGWARIALFVLWGGNALSLYLLVLHYRNRKEVDIPRHASARKLWLGTEAVTKKEALSRLLVEVLVILLSPGYTSQQWKVDPEVGVDFTTKSLSLFVVVARHYQYGRCLREWSHAYQKRRLIVKHIAPPHPRFNFFLVMQYLIFDHGLVTCVILFVHAALLFAFLLHMAEAEVRHQYGANDNWIAFSDCLWFAGVTLTTGTAP